MTLDITHATLIEQRDIIAAKKVSATELTQAYLDRIQRLDASLHCYHEIFVERALQVAADVDAGKITGPLAGVTLGVKDLFCTSYGETTCSSKMLKGYRSPFTATSIQRLENAGAVVIGKTVMDEFALGSSCESDIDGGARNPWDTSRVPGGSSGGSAAAMAASLAAATIGTDTGGSIRQPAALCGVVGFKPSYGRISRYGMVACASSLDQAGPFTRSVGDAALLMQIMAGADPHDNTCADHHVETDLHEVDQPIEGLKIGLPKQYVLEGANHPAVQAAVDAAAKLYQSQGAELVEIDLPHTEYGIPTYYVQMTAELSSNLARYDGVHYGHRTAQSTPDLAQLTALSREEGFGDEVKRRIMLGTYALSSGYEQKYYDKALRVRRLIKNDFDAVFDTQGDGPGVHAILCPTTTHPAFKRGELIDDPLAMYLNDIYTVNANLAGIAGISLPAGTVDVEGAALPIGIQLLGPAFGERTLLRVARQYEKHAGHAGLRPTL
ncbi:MAG: Asp-tRNA(Asn)/Glu-tRNA(Gln) amidotransferase subunit GatA [Algisphaera sp.]